MGEIILTTKDELKDVFFSVFEEVEKRKKATQPPKLYTVSELSRLTGKAYATIKKLVKSGVIRSTKSGLIPEDAIKEYLNLTD